VTLAPEAEAQDAQVVTALHVDDIALSVLEAAARAVLAGAAFLTANYVAPTPACTADHQPRRDGAAAIAKASGRRPTVVGKPSRAAVHEVAQRLELDPRRVAFIGDDVAMDIALGRLAGGQTVLVRSGIDADRIPAGRGPDLVVDGVADLLEML